MNKNTLFFILILALSACKTRKQEPFGRATKLEDKKWMLYALNKKEMPVVDSTKMFTLEIFSDDNAVYLNSECDTTFGLYTAKDDFVFINVLGRTNSQCNPVLFGEYVQQVKSANRFEIKSISLQEKKTEQLILFNEENELLRFNKK